MGKWRVLAIAAMLGFCVPALSMAAVTAEEAAQLDGPALTVLGAERAGNADGTIPAYTGVGIKPPPSWNPKTPGQRPDPYGDKPRFSITAQNAAQYADKLDDTIE